MKSNCIECKFMPIEQAPYGTVAKITETDTYYIQCGKNEVNWVPLDKILIKFHVQNGDLDKHAFIENLLKSYNILMQS